MEAMPCSCITQHARQRCPPPDWAGAPTVREPWQVIGSDRTAAIHKRCLATGDWVQLSALPLPGRGRAVASIVGRGAVGVLRVGGCAGGRPCLRRGVPCIWWPGYIACCILGGLCGRLHVAGSVRLLLPCICGWGRLCRGEALAGCILRCGNACATHNTGLSAGLPRAGCKGCSFARAYIQRPQELFWAQADQQSQCHLATLMQSTPCMRLHHRDAYLHTAAGDTGQQALPWERGPAERKRAGRARPRQAGKPRGRRPGRRGFRGSRRQRCHAQRRAGRPPPRAPAAGSRHEASAEQVLCASPFPSEGHEHAPPSPLGGRADTHAARTVATSRMGLHERGPWQW